MEGWEVDLVSVYDAWKSGQPITKIANYQPLKHLIQELGKLSLEDDVQASQLYEEFCQSQVRTPNLFYSYALLFYALMESKITTYDVHLFNQSPYVRSKDIRYPIIITADQSKREIFQKILRMMHEVELGHYQPNPELEEILYQALYYTTVGWARDVNLRDLLPQCNALSDAIIALIDEIHQGEGDLCDRMCTWRYHDQDHTDITERILELYWQHVYPDPISL